MARRGRARRRGGPLRVAHLTTVDMSLALLLATELAVDVEEGFDVYGVSAPGPYVAEVEGLGVRHVPLPSFTRQWRPLADAAAARELWRAVRSLDLDVLHTHTPKAGVLGRLVGRAARVPVVVNTCHGLWLREGDPAPKRWAVVAVEGLAARCSDAELYQNAVDRLALAWALPDDRSRVVGNGVDLDLFRFDAEGRARVRAELGVAPDEVLVGGVGRWVAEKGVAEYGTAARALTGRARFVWVGPVEEDDVDAPGVERLPPRGRDDMPALYSALDVFVLPSHREGFSRSAMEAAACGRPTVLTDIRGCREIGEDGRHLLLVPAGDGDALTGAVRRLLDDPDLRARLGGAAEARAKDAFDQRAVARASIETYRAVARRKGLAW